jgi:hypothetical protein
MAEPSERRPNVSVTWETQEWVTRPCPALGCDRGRITQVWDWSEAGEHRQTVREVECTLCRGQGVLAMPAGEADAIMDVLVAAEEVRAGFPPITGGGGRYDC